MHTNLDQALESRLLIAITFHFRTDRLRFLLQVAKTLAAFPVQSMHIIICTNTNDEAQTTQIKDLLMPIFSRGASFGGKSVEVFSAPQLEDPWHLPWAHKPFIAREFLDKSNFYTHFIYLEDDIELSFINFCYFLKYRRLLKAHYVIPSFLRIEHKEDSGELYNSDAYCVTLTSNRKVLPIGEIDFMNIENQYCAMFILDYELAEEYVKSRSFSMIESEKVHTWMVAERSAMGLCCENVPDGFFARYVVPIDSKSKAVFWDCAVYHLANNYTNNPSSPLGKILMSDLISRDLA